MTTVLGVGVLFFAILPPMKQFGTMTALTILYSFLSSVWVLPSMLVIWARKSGLAKNLNELENTIPEAKDKSKAEENEEDVEDIKEEESEAEETEDKDEKPEAEETNYDEPEDAKNDIAIPNTDKN